MGNPEGDAFGWFFLGWGVTLLLPLMVLMIANWSMQRRRIPFPLFFLIVFLALGPVGYFQIVNIMSALPMPSLAAVADYRYFPEFYPRLLAEAAAIYCAVTAIGIYGLYKLVTRAAPD